MPSNLWASDPIRMRLVTLRTLRQWVYLSGPVITIAQRLHGWVRLLMTLLPQWCAQHLLALGKLPSQGSFYLNYYLISSCPMIKNYGVFNKSISPNNPDGKTKAMVINLIVLEVSWNDQTKICRKESHTKHQVLVWFGLVCFGLVLVLAWFLSYWPLISLYNKFWLYLLPTPNSS